MEIKKMIEVLLMIDSVISRLLNLCKLKQQALINRDEAQLNKLIENEQVLLNNIAHLTKQQKYFIDKLRTQFNLPADQNSLTEVIEAINGYLPEHGKEKILSLLKLIKSKGAEIQLLNEQNKVLIETSRIFIRELVKAVRGSDSNSIINRKM